MDNQNTSEDKLLLEIQNLKNKIKEYEDKLDDAEFDAENSEKKYNKAKQDLDQANTELSEIKNQLNTTRDDLEQKSLKLNNIEGDFNKKEEAIEFINSLISAPNTEDGDVKDKRNKISKIKGIVSDKILPTLLRYDEITDTEKKEYEEGIWQWANTQEKTWIANKKTIAFVGEFSAGKTSIINRILSQDNPNAPLLSVASKATTAIPTYVSYTSEGERTRFTSNGVLKDIAPSIFHKVKKELLEEIKVSSIIEYFVVAYKNEHLEGLSILDTPGFNSNDEEDKTRTANVIKETDLLFWVVDANTGEINQSSIDIMKEHLANHPMYIVINKADTKAPAELDSLQAHIEKTMKNADIDVKGFLKFSQKHKIDELMKTINSSPSLNNHSNNGLEKIRTKLKNEVEEAKNQYGKFRKRADELDREINETYNQIRNSIDYINDNAYYAHKIPRRDEGFFGGVTYEMEPDEYNELISTLQNIENGSEHLGKLSTILGNETIEVTEIRAKLEKESQQWYELEDLLKDLDKLIADLKDTGSKSSAKKKTNIYTKKKVDFDFI